MPIELTDFDNAFTLIHKTTKYGKEELTDEDIVEIRNAVTEFIVTNNVFGKTVEEIQDWLNDEDAIRNGTTLEKYDPAAAAINTIGRAARESDATDITIATLESAGVTEAIDDNLAAYHEAISDANELGTVDQINALVLRVNDDEA